MFQLFYEMRWFVYINWLEWCSIFPHLILSSFCVSEFCDPWQRATFDLNNVSIRIIFYFWIFVFLFYVCCFTHITSLEHQTLPNDESWMKEFCAPKSSFVVYRIAFISQQDHKSWRRKTDFLVFLLSSPLRILIFWKMSFCVMSKP